MRYFACFFASALLVSCAGLSGPMMVPPSDDERHYLVLYRASEESPQPYRITLLQNQHVKRTIEGDRAGYEVDLFGALAAASGSDVAAWGPAPDVIRFSRNRKTGQHATASNDLRPLTDFVSTFASKHVEFEAPAPDGSVTAQFAPFPTGEKSLVPKPFRFVIRKEERTGKDGHRYVIKRFASDPFDYRPGPEAEPIQGRWAGLLVYRDGIINQVEWAMWAPPFRDELLYRRTVPGTGEVLGAHFEPGWDLPVQKFEGENRTTASDGLAASAIVSRAAFLGALLSAEERTNSPALAIVIFRTFEKAWSVVGGDPPSVRFSRWVSSYYGGNPLRYGVVAPGLIIPLGTPLGQGARGFTSATMLALRWRAMFRMMTATTMSRDWRWLNGWANLFWQGVEKQHEVQGWIGWYETMEKYWNLPGRSIWLRAPRARVFGAAARGVDPLRRGEFIPFAVGASQHIKPMSKDWMTNMQGMPCASYGFTGTSWPFGGPPPGGP